MKIEDESWRLLVGSCLVLLVVIIVWSTAAPSMCELAGAILASEQKKLVSCPDFWLNRYQSLLALVGAFGTVWVVLRQIRHADELEKRRLAREQNAWRGVLSLALSSISEYAEKCTRIIGKLGDEFSASQSLKDSHLSLPDLPLNVIEPLRECIRTAPIAEAIRIAELVGRLQIQHSRLKSLFSEEWRADHAVDQALWDAAEVYVLTSSLFAYARNSGSGSAKPISVSDIKGALRVLRIYDGDRASLDHLLEIRAKAEASAQD